MAAGRMVVNHFWGKPNSTWPGGLWWENHVLGRKAMAAGWKGKNATPWAPSHELLQISLPAHVRDGFRVHCGGLDVDEWAKRASFEEFERVGNAVFTSLFSTKVVDDLRRHPDDERDYAHENVVLYNRDGLLYLLFVHAVKSGDIGCVVNVLHAWVPMMRGAGSMPKYADAVFETLARLKMWPEKLR